MKPRSKSLGRKAKKREPAGQAEGAKKFRSLKRGRTKKAKANARANRQLKAAAIKDGREWCEVGGPQCTGNFFLTWAHGRKRRKLRPGELEEYAILACFNCHRHLDEGMTHAGMARKVRQIINARGKQ